MKQETKSNGGAHASGLTVDSSDLVNREGYDNLFDIQLHDVFDSKKDFEKLLHLMMMRKRTYYQFKVHKSSPSLLVV